MKKELWRNGRILPMVFLKARDFANEITNTQLKQEGLCSEVVIALESCLRPAGHFRPLQTGLSRSGASTRKAAASITGHSTANFCVAAVPPKPGTQQVAAPTPQRAEDPLFMRSDL